ncbi:MAG: 3-deoxy-D-manno-octulosonic acid transferase [Candidatus Zixiibacteriota bacterium]
MNTLITLVLVVFWPILIIISIIARDKLSHRLGIWGDLPDDFYWIHAASMGETKVALIFASMIRRYDSETEILFTVTTPTGYRFLKESLPEKAQVRILPVDYPLFVKIALGQTGNIKGFFMVETEYWFNLMSELKKRHVPIYVINGRLSDSTMRFVKFLGQDLVKNIQCFCVTGREVEVNLRKLGIQPEKIRICGNLKSSIDVPSEIDSDFEFLDKDDFIVCGSTRPGEEEIILDSFSRIKEKFPEIKMIIAPRHLRRISTIEKILDDRNMSFAKLSEMKIDDIILLDSMGVLQQIYQKARIAFIGGTLIDFGGHNPLEAAVFARPVLFGPYYSSAKDSYETLLDTKGGFLIRNSDEFARISEKLLSDDSLWNNSGKNAKKAVDRLSNGNRNYYDFIKELVYSELEAI